MALATRIYDTTQEPTADVRINNVLIIAASPTSAAGIPGVLSIRGQESFDSPVPTIDLEVNRIPTWIKRGMAVSIDAGYSREHVRVFTGGVLARGDEDPDYLRTQCKVTGATSADGTQIAETASLISPPAVWPPIPAGQYIDFAVDNHLLHDAATAASEAARELAERARIPQRPSGEIIRRVIRCVGDLYGAFRSYQIPAVDFSGQTIAAAMGTVLTNSGIAAYDVSGVPAYTLATSGATLERMPGSQQLAKLMIKGCRVQQLKSGVVVVKVIDPVPGPVATFTYSTTTQAYARVIEATGEVRVPFNPLLQIGQTIQLDLDYLSLSGRWFLWGHRWEIGPDGAWSYLDLRGGEDYSGSIGINPVADFTATVVMQVFGTKVYAIVTFDATASYDPDGPAITAANASWTDNQASHKISGTGLVKTVVIDPTAITGDWIVTLTVTDSTGLTGSVTKTVPLSAASSAVQIPALGVANNNNASFSPDGAQSWNNVAGSTCVSVALRPADGVNFGHALYGFSDGHIARTTDSGATLTTVMAAVSSAINCVAWDWRNPLVCWALTENCKLYVSIDAGVTWGLYQDFRTVTYSDGTTTASAVGNEIGLPAGFAGATPVWIFGGDGAGLPLIAHDDSLTHNWVPVGIGGELDTDTPGGTTLRIARAAASFFPELCIGLTNATGGGAGLVALYYTSDFRDPTLWKRGTGLDGGLTDCRVLMGDVPLAGQGVFHAMFNNRDVWSSSNGIAWTKTANVLPLGFSPNHGLLECSVQTGFPDLAGVYLIAAQDAGATGGVFKSADGLATLTEIWPAGGSFPAWPASAVPKMLAVGAPVGTTALVNDRLAAIGTFNNPDQATWLLGPNPSWASAVSITGLNAAQAHILCVSATVWFALADTNDQGSNGGFAAYRTTDGGATWAAAPDPTGGGGGGPVHYARDAGGRLWCIVINTGSGVYHQTKIYYSDDPEGDAGTWTLAKSYGSGTGLPIFYGMKIMPHPTNPNTIAVFGWRQNSVGQDRCFVGYTTDRGTNWTDNQVALGNSIPGTLYWSQNDALLLSNNRIVMLTAGGAAPLAHECRVSDDWGASWSGSKYHVAVTLDRYSRLYSNAAGTVLAFIHSVAGTPDTHNLILSTDGGNTFADTALGTELETLLGDYGAGASAGSAAAGAYYLRVNSGSTYKIYRLSPVSASGVWADITDAYPAIQGSNNGLAVIP